MAQPPWKAAPDRRPGPRARQTSRPAGTGAAQLILGASSQLLQALPEAIVAVGADDNILFVNARAEALLGYPPGALEGRPAESLLPQRAGAAHHRGAEHPKPPKDTLMGAGPDRVVVRADGTELPVDIELAPVSPDGQVVIATIRELSEHQRVEARLHALLEAAPDALVVCGDDGVIHTANRQTEALFGYPRSELLGQPIEVLIPQDRQARHTAHRAEYFADPRVRPMGKGLDLFACRRDGTVFPVDVSLAPVHTDEGHFVCAAIRDITERKRAEKERDLPETRLYQAQRLDSLGQLAGGIAHDFNNLLVVILNYAEFLKEELRHKPELCADVEEIRLAAERAAVLTHQLLIFGRREVVKPQVLSLNEVITDLTKILQRTLGEHIEVRTNLSPDLWPIRVDPTGIEQVLMNLVVNARDAMARGGLLLIETRNVHLDGPHLGGEDVGRGNHVRLSVSDTGVGMNREVAARAFEPFFTTKPKGQGTGLGLATVYGVVRQAGGDVRLYSEPGLGTTFRVFLPAEPTAAAGVREVDDPDAASAASETVLLVEDEDQVRELACRVLRRRGYEVLAARHGADGLELAAAYAGKIDLLLTDVVMPGMSGRELADRLGGQRPGLKILYMSGYPLDVIPAEAMTPDMVLLEKPFTARGLLTQLRAVIEEPGSGSLRAARAAPSHS